MDFYLRAIRGYLYSAFRTPSQRQNDYILSSRLTYDVNCFSGITINNQLAHQNDLSTASITIAFSRYASAYRSQGSRSDRPSLRNRNLRTASLSSPVFDHAMPCYPAPYEHMRKCTDEASTRKPCSERKEKKVYVDEDETDELMFHSQPFTAD